MNPTHYAAAGQPRAYQEFRMRLVDTRRQRGQTQARLACAIPIAQSTLGSWETGLRLPTQENARKWAGALGVPFPPDVDGWFKTNVRYERPPCGTRNGYSYHIRHEEEACKACLAAVSAYMSQRRRRQRRRA